MMKSRFFLTWLVSAIASTIFVLFIVFGVAAFINAPATADVTLFPGVFVSGIRLISVGVVLVGTFGLLGARMLAVLVEIERSMQAVRGPETAESSFAYRFGQLVGKIAQGGK